MIAEAAVLLLGLASMSDIARQDRSRIMLGRWRELFAGHGLAWGLDLVHYLKQSGNEEAFLKARKALSTRLSYDLEFKDATKEDLYHYAIEDIHQAIGHVIYLELVQCHGIGEDEGRQTQLLIGTPSVPFRVIERWPHIKPNLNEIYTEWEIPGALRPRWILEPLTDFTLRRDFDRFSIAMRKYIST